MEPCDQVKAVINNPKTLGCYLGTPSKQDYNFEATKPSGILIRTRDMRMFRCRALTRAALPSLAYVHQNLHSTDGSLFSPRSSLLEFFIGDLRVLSVYKLY